MVVTLTEGQAGDNPQLLPLLDQVRVARPGRGRPRKRPDRVVADKAYSHPSTRAALRRRGIAVTIPERSDQINRRAAKGAAGGRPPAFDKDIYKQRNLVERCFNRLKQFVFVEESVEPVASANPQTGRGVGVVHREFRSTASEDCAVVGACGLAVPGDVGRPGVRRPARSPRSPRCYVEESLRSAEATITCGGTTLTGAMGSSIRLQTG
jgi:transposase